MLLSDTTIEMLHEHHEMFTVCQSHFSLSSDLVTRIYA